MLPIELIDIIFLKTNYYVIHKCAVCSTYVLNMLKYSSWKEAMQQDASQKQLEWLGWMSPRECSDIWKYK